MRVIDFDSLHITPTPEVSYAVKALEGEICAKASYNRRSEKWWQDDEKANKKPTKQIVTEIANFRLSLSISIV